MTRVSEGPPTGLRLAAFVAPQLPLSLISLPVLLYTVPLYDGELKMDLVLVGGLLSLARLWDLATEPLIGLLIDRVRTPWGRRRPWMVLAAPMLMIGLWLLFVPVTQTPGAAYVFGCLIAIFTGWTVFNLAHVSWAGELAPQYDQRTRIYGWLMFAFLIGILASSIIPAIANRLSGVNTTAHTSLALAWVIVPSIPITAALALWSAREPRTAAPVERTPFLKSLKVMFASPSLPRLMFTNAGEGLAGGSTAALIVFFGVAQLRLQVADVQILLLVNFGSALLAVPLWMRLAYRFGKHRALALSAILNCLFGPLILLAPTGNLLAAGVVFALLGANFGATPSLIRAIANDAVDEDYLATGEQRTALYLGVISMANKVGFAIPPLLTAAVLAWAGYVPTLGPGNSGHALGWLTLMFVGLPILANAAIALVMWGFPIDATRQAEVRAALAERGIAAG